MKFSIYSICPVQGYSVTQRIYSSNRQAGPSPFRATALMLALVAAFPPTLAFAQVAVSGDTTPGAVSPVWNVGGNLTIGVNGVGTMDITGGGVVSNTQGFIGQNSGSEGTVTVSGSGSQWNNAGALFVGQSGKGGLTISGGATVSSTIVEVGLSPAAYGEVKVTGAGTVWNQTATGGITSSLIGRDGKGSVSVEGGAVVNNQNSNVSIAAIPGSEGSLTVTGIGSAWNTAGTLQVGARGNGRLNILDGGVVNSSAAVVGFDPDAQGTVNIAGPGSTWNAGGPFALIGDLAVTAGRHGVGTMNLSDGGTFRRAGDVWLGFGNVNIGAPAGSPAAAPGFMDANRIQFQADTEGAINFNHTSADYTFGAEVASANGVTSGAGTGTINQLAGVTRLTAASGNFAGTTNVSGGTLLVDGVLGNAFSAVNVAAGGTLGGTGTIGGAVNNSGTLSVGTSTQADSITVAGSYTTVTGAMTQIAANSTLTVGSTFTHAAGSTLNVELGSTQPVISAASANLDGMLNVTGFGGGSQPVRASDVVNGQPYTLLRTTNGITGLFANSSQGASGADYLLQQGSVTGNDYVLAFGLAWNQGGAAQGTGAFTLGGNTQFDVDVALADQAVPPGGFASGWDGRSLTKNGTGLLVLSGANTYTGSTTVNDGILRTGIADTLASSSDVIVNGGTLDLAGNRQRVQRLAGTGGSILLNGATLTAVNATVADSSTFAGDIGDGAAAGGVFAKTGDGTLTLTGRTSYTGATQLQGGTLVLDGSAGGAQLNSNVMGQTGTTLSLIRGASLTGMIDPANVGIDAASTWNMTANSTVDTLTLAGMVNVVAPASQSSPGRTLTVNSLAGQGGTIGLHSVLGGDSSPTDQIILNGGTASGTTNLAVHNQGGTGAQTRVGIPVVVATNGAKTTDGAFTLSPQSSGYRAPSQTLAVGAYDYGLERGGNGGDADSWYLTSQLRPEAGAYLANNQAARQMFMMTLRDREGYAQPNGGAGGAGGTGSWGRIVGRSGSGEMASGALSTKLDSVKAQVGTDVFRGSLSNGGSVYAGVMGSWGRLWTDARSSAGKASGTVDGYAVGAYGTWYQKDRGLGGAYVDTWAQYQWTKNKVTGAGLPQERYDGRGATASVEGGYGFLLRQDQQTKLFLEPQIQLAYVSYSVDDHTEAGGTRVRYSDGNGIVARAGARLYADHALDRQSSFRPYVEANYWYNQRGGQLRMNNDLVPGDAPRSFGELKVGAINTLGKRWLIGGDLGVQVGGQHYQSVTGQINLKYAW